MQGTVTFKSWPMITLWFNNSETGKRIEKYIVFDDHEVEVASGENQRQVVESALRFAEKENRGAVQIVDGGHKQTSCQGFLYNSQGGYLHSVIRNLRIHAGTLRGPNHEAAREAANALESLATAARHVVKSVDNWKQVQPCNSQVQQDVESLRAILDASRAAEG